MAQPIRVPNYLPTPLYLPISITCHCKIPPTVLAALRRRLPTSHRTRRERARPLIKNLGINFDKTVIKDSTRRSRENGRVTVHFLSIATKISYNLFWAFSNSCRFFLYSSEAGLKTPQANNGSGFANSAASAAVCPATFALAFRPIILIDGTSGEQPPDNTHPERYYRAPS